MASEVEGSNGLTTDNIGGEIQKSYLDEVKKDEIHVPLDDNVEEARAGLDKTSDIQYDVMHTSYNKIKKMALLKKVHWLVAIVVNVVCILVWRYSSQDPVNGFWWWIIPLFMFSITLTVHHHIENGKYLEGVVWATVLLNIMFFTTNLFTVERDDINVTWWVYPAIISAMMLIPFYHYMTKIDIPPSDDTSEPQLGLYNKISQEDLFRYTLLEYVCVCLILFFTWINLGLGHPWFFYPMLVLASPLLHWRMRMFEENRFFVLAIPQLVILNLIIFVAWEFTYSKVPWFLPILGVSVLVEAFLWFRWKKSRNRELDIERAERSLSKDLSVQPEEEQPRQPSGVEEIDT